MSNFSSILGGILASISDTFRDHFRDNPFLQNAHAAYTGVSLLSFQPPKKHSFGDPVSSHFSDLFSTPLWNTILEPLMPIWSQKAGFWDPFWNPLGPKMAPKTPQERPKPCIKRSRERPKSAQGHFGSRRAFGGPILDPFGTLWDPFGAHLGPIWDPFGTIRDHSETTKQQKQKHNKPTKQQSNKSTQ